MKQNRLPTKMKFVPVLAVCLSFAVICGVSGDGYHYILNDIEDYEYCPPDWIKVPAVSFNVCWEFNKDLKSWGNAAVDCNEKGGSLLSIRQELEWMWLRDMLEKRVEQLHDYSFESHSIWMSGKKVCPGCWIPNSDCAEYDCHWAWYSYPGNGYPSRAINWDIMEGHQWGEFDMKWAWWDSKYAPDVIDAWRNKMYVHFIYGDDKRHHIDWMTKLALGANRDASTAIGGPSGMAPKWRYICECRPGMSCWFFRPSS